MCLLEEVRKLSFGTPKQRSICKSYAMSYAFEALKWCAPAEFHCEPNVTVR